jgi:hypothetical protein
MTGDIDIYSKMHFKDINEAGNIIAYIDFDQLIDKQFILKYMNDIVNLNPELKKAFVDISGNVLFNTVDNFDINQHYKIKYNHFEKFDKYINNLLNEKFKMEVKWMILWCIDKEFNKSRVYIKIHHSYGDGYKIFKMVLQPIDNKVIDITKQLQKNKNTLFEKIYYYFIGTIILLLVTLKNLFKLLISNEKKDGNGVGNEEKEGKEGKEGKTDYIICKKLNFTKIKEYTKKHNITINDFLYFLMVRVDKLYFKRNKDLQVVSPINISGINNLNNICPVITVINNSQENNILLKQIHHTFSYLKYSLFIPLFNYMLNIVASINIDILSFLHNTVSTNCDYSFSNVIGPQLNVFKNMKITDIHFLLKCSKNLILYNIISSGDNINITCTFKEGRVENKKRFKKCIYKVYSDLVLDG